MNVILNELKKIFNMKSIILLLIVNVVMSFLFMEFDIRYFPNGEIAESYYNIFVEMEDEYGEFMDENEFNDFKGKYMETKKEVDKYIKSREDLKELGITNYDEFNKANSSNYINYKKFEKIHWDILFEKKIDIFWEVPSRKDVIESYEKKEEIMIREKLNEKQEIRVKEIIDKDIETSIFTDVVFSNYNGLIKNVVRTILLSVMILITPIYTRDNKENINYLQYTSKVGRKIFKKKILSGLVATFILVSIELVCFLSLYSTNNISMFLDTNINSVFNSIISWYDLTFIQYIILTIIGTYILAFIFSLISMFVSSISRNYIVLIAIQLSIALFTFVVLLRYIIENITSIDHPKHLLGLSYLILIVISSILIIIRWKKEKKSDVLY